MAETAREELARLRAQRSELPTQQDTLQRLGTLESRVAGPLDSINSTTRRLNESLRAAQQRYQAGNNLTKDALANLRAKQAARRRSPDAGLALLSKFAEDSPAAALGAGYLAFKVDQASQSNAAIADAKDALNEAQELRSQEFAELQQNSQLETSLAELDISQQERNIDIGKTDYSTQVNAAAADIQFARDGSQNDLDYAEESVLQDKKDAASLRRTRVTASAAVKAAQAANIGEFNAALLEVEEKYNPLQTPEQEQTKKDARASTLDNLKQAHLDSRGLLGVSFNFEKSSLLEEDINRIKGLDESNLVEFFNVSAAVNNQITDGESNYTADEMLQMAGTTIEALDAIKTNTNNSPQVQKGAADRLDAIRKSILEQSQREKRESEAYQKEIDLVKKQYGF